MCLIQLPAAIAVLLLAIRGRYHDHIFLFYFIIGAAVLTCWLWSIVRTGRHIRSGEVTENQGKTSFAARPFLIEFACNTLAIVSIVASVVGMILSFL